MRIFNLCTGLALTPLLLMIYSQATAGDSFSAYVNDAGSISLPADFRDSMIHLGSWYIPAGAASGFHDVYTEKSSAVAYRKTGEFPDGATLVKELRASKVGDYTTGQDVAHATGELKQWFVMIKDRKNRFADNPIWGDGWGWALFKPGDSKANSASNYKNDCLGCHLPARETDWVYTEAYPGLVGK